MSKFGGGACDCTASITATMQARMPTIISTTEERRPKRRSGLEGEETVSRANHPPSRRAIPGNPGSGNQQENQKAGDGPQFQQMAQVAGHQEENKDGADGKNQSNEALGEHIQSHGCGDTPAQPARRLFLLQSRQKKIKPQGQP